jgi:hypothetical protein
MYSKTREFKTREYRDWESALLHALVEPEPKAALTSLREAFDLNKFCIAVSFTTYVPRHDLFNKQSTISSRNYDLSNWEKSLLDILVTPRYHLALKQLGGGNINTDDKHVVSLRSAKRLSLGDKYWLKITFLLLPLARLAAT